MAKNKNEIITIDLAPMALIEQDGDKFLMDPRAEDTLLMWNEFKARVEEVDKMIKDTFSKSMTPLHAKKVEGEAINVIKRFYGERFQIYDKDVAVGLGMAKEVVTVKIDTKAIEEYEKDTGELPDGIKLRERTESISFMRVKEKGEKHGR